jgi:hypothetical protein
MFTKEKKTNAGGEKTQVWGRGNQKSTLQGVDNRIEPLLSQQLTDVTSIAKDQQYRIYIKELDVAFIANVNLSDSENTLLRKADTRWSKKRQEIITHQMFSYFFLLEQRQIQPDFGKRPLTIATAIFTKVTGNVRKFCIKLKRLCFQSDSINMILGATRRS